MAAARGKFRAYQRLALLSLAFVQLTSIGYSADLFILRGGNRVEGTWVNRSTEKVDSYIVRTQEGSEIVLPSASVTRVVQASAEERRYETLLPRMPETADGNWRMAEWCRQKGLSKHRTRHLEATIELDSDHAAARRALGYTNRDGQWLRSEDVRRARGYKQYKGKWYLPQELEILKAREAEQRVTIEWRDKLQRWHKWLDGKRAKDAIEQFELIEDPAAVGELARLLSRERGDETQKLLMKTLARFGGPTAENALVAVLLQTDNETIRELARDLIVKLGGRWAYPTLIAELQSKNVYHLRRAAWALGLLGNQEAIPPLIDVLVTEHKLTLVQGGPGSINTTFGSSPTGGGTGFSTGAKVRTERRQLEHAEVLNALKILSGKNFGYDQFQWTTWFADSNTPASLDLRRGS